MKTRTAKFLAVLMCLMTAVAFMPTLAFATDAVNPGEPVESGEPAQASEPAEQDELVGPSESTNPSEPAETDGTVKASGVDSVEPAAEANITITVSNQGVLATAFDDSVVLNRGVTVKDTDADGHLSVDEALVAAHDIYFKGGAETGEAGYAASDSSWGKSVTKLWGVDTYNTLFFINGKGLANGVGDDEVKAGDVLYASVNSDNTNYADWYTYFNKTSRTVNTNEEFTLNLKGFQGMAGGAAKNVEGVKVGTWNSGTFQQIDGKVTDEDGNVELSFDKAGTYVVTAGGAVKDTWNDWSGKSITADCPIMAPACVVTVTGSKAADATVYLTVNNKGNIAKDKNEQKMTNREVTVEDINKDGVLSYNEALVAAHNTYFEGGAVAGYTASSSGWVTNLWGISDEAYLFFINNEGISTSVSSDSVKAGDKLYASILKDGANYSDYYGSFNEESKSVALGESFTLKLSAKPGMMPGDAVAVADAQIGLFDDSGTFTQIQHKETDSNGKVKLSFNKEGTYYVTTKDAIINDVSATDWYLMDLGNSVYGKINYETYDSTVAYTEADYGDGPYPADEVKYVDFSEWQEAQDDYNVLHSNSLIVNAPVMAPVCKVTVGGEENETIHALKKALAEIKALTIVPKVKASATSTKGVSLSWSSLLEADGYELSADNGTTWKAVEGKEQNISGLVPGTSYKYQMRGYTYVNGEGSDVVYSSVSQAAVTTPLAKAGITSLKTKSKKLTVKWKSVEGAKGYQVWIGTNSAVTKGVVKYTTSSIYKVTKKLKKNKNYYVKVRAYKGNVYGAWSASKKIKCR